MDGESHEEIPLWPGVAPGSEGWSQQEQRLTLPPPAVTVLRNVVRPTLTPVLPPPEARTGVGMLVCPGGGYFILAAEHEGMDVARWFADRGVAAFVLKYRLTETPAADADMLAMFTANATGAASGGLEGLLHRMEKFAEVPAADGVAALRMIHDRAEEWGVDRLGVIGFSAGGRLLFDLVAAPPPLRPAFAAAIYPAYPKDRTAPDDAPPLFLAVAEDDPLVSHTLEARAAWIAARRPVETHLYQRGAHGFGMLKQGLPADGWIERVHDWMNSL
jgi:acetyl esterase/lipase